jgi:hypothetical protein
MNELIIDDFETLVNYRAVTQFERKSTDNDIPNLKAAAAPSGEITELTSPEKYIPPLRQLPPGTKRLEFKELQELPESSVVAVVIRDGLYLAELTNVEMDMIVFRFANDHYEAVMPTWPSFRGARTVTAQEKALWDGRP